MYLETIQPAFWPAALLRRTSVSPQAKTLAQGEFISPEHFKSKGGAALRAAKPKRKTSAKQMSFFLVRLTGVEPVRPSGHKHLKLASLPIPAQPQTSGFQKPL